MPPLVIDLADPASPEIRDLVAQLDAMLTAMYPPQSNHFLSIEQLRQPNVTMIAARLEGRVVGCGAIVDQERAYAEIKRMYVVAGCRGLGIGRGILDELEARARAGGLPVARLETGVLQAEAIALYERAGYRRCAPFGDYRPDPLSLFMEKALRPPAAPPGS